MKNEMRKQHNEIYETRLELEKAHWALETLIDLLTPTEPKTKRGQEELDKALMFWNERHNMEMASWVALDYISNIDEKLEKVEQDLWELVKQEEQENGTNQ